MRKRAAFTLIEIVVVVAIVSALFFIVLPVFSNFLGSLELKGCARQIVSDLRAAQDKAITLKSTITVQFTPKTLFGEPATYVVKRVSPTSGRENIIKSVKLGNKFDFNTPETIKFSKSGSPPAGGSGTVELKYIGGRIMRIIISSPAGRVRMEQ